MRHRCQSESYEVTSGKRSGFVLPEVERDFRLVPKEKTMR